MVRRTARQRRALRKAQRTVTTKRRNTSRKNLLEWRRKQRKGAIMNPKTFRTIYKRAKKKYGKKRAKKIAGAAYWRTVRAKYKRRRK